MAKTKGKGRRLPKHKMVAARLRKLAPQMMFHTESVFLNDTADYVEELHDCAKNAERDFILRIDQRFALIAKWAEPHKRAMARVLLALAESSGVGLLSLETRLLEKPQSFIVADASNAAWERALETQRAHAMQLVERMVEVVGVLVEAEKAVTTSTG